jgi:nucleoside-diphosphate-sugar epimerase
VLVTGGTGFVGSALCPQLLAAGWDVRAVVRDASRVAALPPDVRPVVWDLDDEDMPPDAMTGVDVVIHLAARAHAMGESGTALLERYRAANVLPTRRLVRAARGAGARRFVFVSSIKVLGEGDSGVLTARSPLAPVGPYAVSKAEAESVVQRESGEMEWTIVRPTFVYGAGGKGNFPRLVRLARLARHFPLPLGSIRHRRSIVYVGNLASLLTHCASARETAAAILNVADSPALSTPELIRAMARAEGGRAALPPFPLSVLGWVARGAGMGSEWSRLSQPLEVDTAPLARLGWRAPYGLEAALARSLHRERARAV